MAVNYQDLVARLHESNAEPFQLIADIASFSAVHGVGGESTELVIRALDDFDRDGEYGEILRSLMIQHGLYPYIVGYASGVALRDAVVMEMNRPNANRETIFHRIQSQVFHRLVGGENVILSAPTSFGKSVVVDALVQTGNYRNIVVIVPTIALLDETRRRLSRYEGYKIVTHPNQDFEDRNILVMTQERLLAVPTLPNVDLFFIDEFYKLADEKDGLLDQRSSILNQAFLRLIRTGAQFYFAGPVVEGLSDLLPENFKASFIRTNFSTVAADTIRIKASNDSERIAHTVDLVGAECEPTLVYCQSPQKIRKVLEEIISLRSVGVQAASGLPEAAAWIEENYHSEWIVAKALRLGVGVHHGRLPRWLAQRVVQGFESGDLDVLICTNSLIEGVNTRAKRIIILDRNVANRAYNYFTFANIKGRVGRMFKHFVGQIYLFHDEPRRELPSIDIPGVTQSDSAPGSLLVQIEEEDWSEQTRDRLTPVLEDARLDVEVLREVKGVEPESIAQLANHLRTLPVSRLRQLQWSTSYPNWQELNLACQLIWDYIAPDYHVGHGAYTARQLAFRVNQAALAEGRMKDIIASFVDDSNDDRGTVDDRIEAAFDFVRYWLDHNFPASLRALSVISGAVLSERGLSAGSFDGFAARVESMFSAPHLATIEEYGLPLEVSRQLVRSLGGARTLDEMLSAITSVAARDVSTLSAFEASLLEDFVESL